MKAHVIEDGKVINTIEVESLEFMPNLVEAKEGGIGDSYADGKFTRPPATKERTRKIDINSELTESEKQALIDLVRI